ncbi:MAG: GNAT family N-acetyltransferase [Gemmatimonadota bacterium]|nr:GNAT family N-acetyltransferase [Gemmatimonadota bacterium]
MSVEVRRENHPSLTEYAATVTAFEVREAIGPVSAGAAPHPLPRRVVSPAFRKDYDAIPGNGPDGWHARFAVDRAHFLAAYDHGRRVGGAVVIVEPADVARLGGDTPFALLWDVRVTPEARGRGIGRALLDAAGLAAREAGCGGMIAETQDINVAACQLYANAGYSILGIDPAAYPDIPGETQIVWTKSFELPLASG